MPLRPAAFRYPRFFATKNRTQFLAYVAAFEPLSMTDLCALVEAKRNAVLVRFHGLERHGIVIRFKGRGAGEKPTKWLVALNRGYPAFEQVRRLLDELNKRIALPAAPIAKRRDRIPSVKVAAADAEAILGPRIQRRSMILLGVLGAADVMQLKECWRSDYSPTWHSMDALVRTGILKRDTRTSVARLTINPKLECRRQFVALLRALAQLNKEYAGLAEHARDNRPYLRKETANRVRP